ncbi:MAG: glucuronosyltransferase [Novosphingobium sp.]
MPDPALHRIAARRPILAVSSSGGHWSQLLLLREAFAGHDVTYACTLAGVGAAHGLTDVRLIADCNRATPLALLRLARQALSLLARVRPQAIVSTGALPGLVFIVLGWVFDIRTVWVESMANSEALSMSGRWASMLAHECLVQWPVLAEAGRTRYAGSVL